MNDTYTVRQGATVFQAIFAVTVVSAVVLCGFLLSLLFNPIIPTTRLAFSAPAAIGDQVLLMGALGVSGMLTAFVRTGHLMYEGAVKMLPKSMDNALRGLNFVVLVVALSVMALWAQVWLGIEEYARTLGLVACAFFSLWLGYFVISGVLKQSFSEAYNEDLKQKERDEILHMKNVMIPDLISEVHAKCFGDDVTKLNEQQFQMLLDLKSISQDMKHLNQLKKFAAELRYFIEKGVSYNAGKVLLQEKIDRAKLRKTI